MKVIFYPEEEREDFPPDELTIEHDGNCVILNIKDNFCAGGKKPKEAHTCLLPERARILAKILEEIAGDCERAIKEDNAKSDAEGSTT